jgi:hypothetical protein
MQWLETGRKLEKDFTGSQGTERNVVLEKQNNKNSNKSYLTKEI